MTWIDFTLPDSEITVLIRLKSEEWPIVIGFHDGETWLDSSAATIDSEVIGWMNLEDAAKILDQISPNKSEAA